jgi:hypothetical protein
MVPVAASWMTDSHVTARDAPSTARDAPRILL